MKEWTEQIKAEEIHSCYLFYGKEAYLKQYYVECLKKAVLGQDFEDMNVNRFEGKKIPVSAILDASETLPFLAEKRLVLVDNSALFYPGRKEDSEAMASYLQKLPESACLVFLEEEADKRSRLYKAAVKYGKVIACDTPDEKALLRFVTESFRKAGVSVKNPAAVYFLRCVGGSMELLEREIEKLSAYVGTGGEVTKKAIEEVTARMLESRIFDLVGAMGNKRVEQAVALYRQMLLLKESPIMILSMVTRQLRLLYQCKYLEEKEHITSIGEIARRLSQRDFVIRQCMQQAHNFSLETLSQALKDCLQTDMEIKSGRMAGDLAVEMLIVAYGTKRE